MRLWGKELLLAIRQNKQLGIKPGIMSCEPPAASFLLGGSRISCGGDSGESAPAKTRVRRRSRYRSKAVTAPEVEARFALPARRSSISLSVEAEISLIDL